MVRDRGLADAELVLHDAPDVAGGEFAVGEQFDDAPAHRVAEDVECVHAAHYSPTTYISQ